ncbi:MFS transporter [Paracoccus sp. 1_MG-2023]|uniref:MFS transporter n=1 Tax=unclassified Paracoccus (in: a-proteobacteria) TaxID=2688777 RepID=UPI001C083265|nr:MULTISPECIES: MFS transporter [unclassified Paracoccus (in: a-proteobacteria)]MBU2958202.1 MFS transporter [Paracoccus sp. C2R09]MDO6668329.1 MFS transporter [Paracoccus sp. 1_MG-2023]
MRLSSERAAVSALFLLNGLLVGSWSPRIPALMERLQITESRAGLLVLCLGLGSITVMPFFGAMTARSGSRQAAWLAACLTAPSLIWISVAPGFWTAALAVFLFGGTMGGMDVAMNANAVAMERRRSRAIMSSCHGFWSLGGVIGAGLGGIVLDWAGELVQGLVVTAIFAAGLVWAGPRLLRDPPAPDQPRTPLRLPRSPLPYLIGIVALASMIPEGAILDWAAVYLEREMGASLSLAGWGFAACAATMAVLRFAGDGLRNRFGAVRTMRASALIAMAGLGIAGLAGTPPMAITGFALAGIGIANLMPIALSAAGNLPGMAAGVGLSVVTMMGYSGILLAPAAIGWLAEHASLGAIYLGLGVLLLLPLGLSRLVAAADFHRD